MEACLDEDSITMLFNPSPDALFPNLRFLSWKYGRPFPLVHIAAQPLRILHLDFRHADIPNYRNILHSVGNLCPHIKKFCLYMPCQNVELDDIISNYVLRWPNLRLLECHDVALNADAILHISRMSTLTDLLFLLNEEVPDRVLPSDHVESVAVRDSIRAVVVRCKPIRSYSSSSNKGIHCHILWFPFQTDSPVFHDNPMEQCSSDTLTDLSILSQRHPLRRLWPCGEVGLDNHSLAYDDLYPCMAFGNLRSLKLNFRQAIGLTDNDLVELGSAWPHLEDLHINSDSGWRSPGGITLHRLVRLLRTCTALRKLSILFDTPTFTHIPEGMDVSYPPRQLEEVNVLHSPLQPEMVASVVDVLVAIGFSPRRGLFTWMHFEISADIPANATEIRQSWGDVDAKVGARLGVNEPNLKNGRVELRL